MNTKIYYLSNGIPVVVCDAMFHTNKILISLNFGAYDEAPQEYGITHFIEHLLGQSVTGDPSFRHLKQMLEVLGGYINLYTDYEKIGCFVKVLPEHLISVIKILGSQITNPVFDATRIEQEKKIILDEYRRAANNSSWALLKYNSLFKNTGLGHCVLGTPETIQSFTSDGLKKYYFSHLSNDKINIVFVGRVPDRHKLLSELESVFGKIPFVSYRRDFLPVQQIIKNDLKPDAKNVKLALAFDAKISYDRLNQIAIGIFRKILQDRLMNALRYENGLVYSIQCLTMGIHGAKLYTIETETLPQDIESVTRFIATVCYDVINTHPVTTKELEIAKNVIKFQSACIIDSIDKSCDLYSKYVLHYNSVFNIEQETQILNKIQLSDINNIAKQFFNTNVSIVSQGPDFDCDVMKIWREFFQ